jgi:hypothetical protein
MFFILSNINMLTEYNKFLRKHLKGGKMTMKEAAKLWKNQVSFRFIEEKVTDKEAKLTDKDHDLLVSILFKKGSTAVYKEKKIINKIYKEGNFSLYLTDLYNGSAPQGSARRYLCSLLKKSLEMGNIQEDDYIYLFAIGDVGGSYIQLIKMYSRMGFDVYGTKDIMSDIYEDMRLDREPVEGSSSSNVLMATTVKNLLKWCASRYT